MNSFKTYLEELLFSGKRVRVLKYRDEDNDEATRELVAVSIWKVTSDKELSALEKKFETLKGVALPNGDLYIVNAMNNVHLDIIEYLQESRVGILKIPGKITTFEYYDDYIKYFITLTNSEHISTSHIWGIGESQDRANNQILITLNRKFPKHLFLPDAIFDINHSSFDEFKEIINRLPKMYSSLQLEKRIERPGVKIQR
jgi:hypothetical protein